MKIGPKYKIARRLGAPIFEKTQTPKYTLSLARKERSASRGRGKPKSEFGRELVEKQKTRFSYGITERQLKNYVGKALRTTVPVQTLFALLERRLDNVLFRAGLAKTRLAARQIASHGHALINGKRVTVPSIILSRGDAVTLRGGSVASPLFGEVSERMQAQASMPWFETNPVEKKATVIGQPVYNPQEHVFDLRMVIEFYNR